MIKELAYGRPKRIIKGLKRLSSRINAALIMFSDRHCMGVRDYDLNSYSWLTFDVIGERAKNFGHGLRRLIEARSFLGICAKNRPEWMITDFACMFQSFVSVPIHCLFTDHEIEHILNNTKVVLVVCDKFMLKRFIELRRRCPTLKHIVSMDQIHDAYFG